jgi:hypothetical protein
MDQTVAEPAAAESIQANISGEISGQVAVGNYILQIGSVHGGVVNINVPEQRPRLKARPAPVYVLPRRQAGLLDRVDEVAAAARALPAAQPVEFHAENGTGKTALLRMLARHTLVNAFRDGVIYLSARDQTPGDLLQSIFAALFEYDAPYKPSEGEIRHALQGKRALILLDDVELSREEVEALFDAAPECAFLLASPDRKLWSEGLSLSLPGLPAPEARRLLERELARPLSEQEDAAVEELLAALSGNPLAIIQAVALIRDQGYAPETLAAAARDGPLERKIAALALGGLTRPEQRIIASIASLDGAPLNPRHLPALTGIPAAGPTLDRLQKRGLVRANGKGFTLAGSFAMFVQESWDLSGWRAGLLDYFRAWASARLGAPEEILEEAESILRLIEWANRSSHWDAALRLIRVTEGALALGLRWGAWERALQGGLEAARALGNLGERAWALHQLGTRALGLGEREAARNLLVQALRLRERLGDRPGAALTRHNLDLLLGPPGGNNGDSAPKPPSNPATALYNLAIGALAALVVSGALLSTALLALGFIAPLPPARPPEAPLATTTEVAQLPVTGGSLTPSPSPTPTPTATATEPPGTATPTATGLPSPTQTELPPPTVTQCAPQRDWPVYTIRPGDTLFALAQAVDASVADLVRANCLPDTRIFSGRSLFVPRLPEFPPTGTPTPTLTITPTATTVTPGPQYPDLTISIATGSLERLAAEGSTTYFGLPFAMTASNWGQEAAGPFNVTIYARGVEPSGEGLLQEEPSIEPLILSVDDPLEAGASRSLSARLEFQAPSGWRSVEAWAIIDDCSGQEPAEPCQVEESEEGNNRSETFIVPLPENQAPTAAITSLDNKETVFKTSPEGDRWVAEIELEGYAEDPEDGPLGGDQLVWTTDRTDLQEAYLNTGARVPVRLYSDQCAETAHTVTLTAVDGQDGAASDSRRIILVAGDCTPSLEVESPAEDTYPPSGYEDAKSRYFLDLTGNAQAYDALGRPIGDRIEWSTDRTDIQKARLGRGEKPELWLYLPDDPEKCDEATHTVTVRVTDQEGNQSEKSIPIRIEEYCSDVD